MKIDKEDYEILKKGMQITLLNYDIDLYDKENIKGYVDCESLLSMIEDLIVEYHRLEEKLEEQEEYCREHHQNKPINYYEEYGINEKDFH